MNRVESPRVGVIGTENEHAIGLIEARFPNVYVHDDINDLYKRIPPSELDLIVAGPDAGSCHGHSTKAWQRMASQASVIVFGSSPGRCFPVAGTDFYWHTKKVGHGAELEVTEKAPPLLRRPRDHLVRKLGSTGAKNQLLVSSDYARNTGYNRNVEGLSSDALDKSALVRAVTPALPLAVQHISQRISGNPPRGFAWLPTLDEVSTDWIVALALTWGAESVPGLKEWATDADGFLCEEELEIRKQLVCARKRHEELIRESDAEIDVLTARFNKAKLRAEQTIRRILTKQDEELVAAVASTFDDLGFDVENVDEGRPDGQHKTEDLRLRISDEPDLIALVEVKGEKQGTKARHLARIQQYASVFSANNGRVPSQLIFVTNYCYMTPLVGRPRYPLEGAEEYISEFPGLVVGTMDLFRLHRDRNKIGLPEARRLLMEPQGTRLSYPPEE